MELIVTDISEQIQYFCDRDNTLELLNLFLLTAMFLRNSGTVR